MDFATLQPAAFRHVVFPQPGFRAGAALNFGGTNTPPTAIAHRETGGTEEDAFVRWLFRQGGLDTRDYKPHTLSRRVHACLRVLRAGTIAQARAAVQRSNSNLTAALSALVIGVTGFFRDAPAFSFLEQQVLPALTSHGSSARICSVGCSDGPELYSVAMLLAEQRVLHRCQLLGTDCRLDAISRAAEGLYEPDAIAAIPVPLRSRYGKFEGLRWRVNSWMRSVVQWRCANALEIVGPPQWDLILCRNMAIYLSAPAAARLWERLAASLAPGGVLMLGKAERPQGVTGLGALAPGFYRRLD